LLCFGVRELTDVSYFFRKIFHQAVIIITILNVKLN